MEKYIYKKILLIVFLLSIIFMPFLEFGDYMRSIVYADSDCRPEANKYNNQKSGVYIWQYVEGKEAYNNELQLYNKDNVTINGDSIEIISKKEKISNTVYTSGIVESIHAYKYGRFEFTIKVPEGEGIFPSICLLPANGDGLPEIDLFEMIGNEPNIFYGVIHFNNNGFRDRDYFSHKVQKKDQYSITLEWTDKSLTWYIDDKKIFSTAKGVPNQYMYIIVNQSIGGDWAGKPNARTIFPNQFKILSSNISPEYTKERSW